MLPNERAEIQLDLEKPWYQSKKFLAFFLLLSFMSAFVGCLVYWNLDFSWQAAVVLLALIFTMGIVTLSFLSSQTRIDKLTRGITLSSNPTEDDATRKIMMILDDETRKKR